MNIHKVDLKNYFNSKVVSWNGKKLDGDYTLRPGQSFPGESLPNDETIFCNGIEFCFPNTASEAPDHIRCEGQTIYTHCQKPYKYIHLLGGSIYGSYRSVIKLNYFDDVSHERIMGFSNIICTDKDPHSSLIFNDRVALTFSHIENYSMPNFTYRLIHQSIALDHTKALTSIEAPDNPFILFFSITFSDM